MPNTLPSRPSSGTTLSLLLSLLLSLAVANGASTCGFRFVSVNSSSLYLLWRQRSATIVHSVPNRATVEAYGCNATEHVEALLSETDISGVAYMRAAKPLRVLPRKDNSPDEVVNEELTKIQYLQPRLLENITHLGKMVNPAVLKWRGRLLLAMGRSWGVGSYQENDDVEFMRLNRTPFAFRSQQDYLGIGLDLGPLNVKHFMGQDPRLLPLPDGRILIAFTDRFISPLAMGAAFLDVNASGHAFIAKVYYRLTSDHDHRDSQKNWSPFLYNNTVLFVQSINPLRIMSAPLEYSRQDSQSQIIHNDPVPASTFSLSPYVHIAWAYGHIRGGTNAVLLPSTSADTYLALFHSSTTLPYNGRRTYFMGAYTFTVTNSMQPLLHTPHTPPAVFKLHSISPLPILDTQFYTGPWDFLKKRFLDYVLFPVSIFIADTNTLYVSFGHNDEHGYLATIQIDALLESMVPVGH